MNELWGEKSRRFQSGTGMGNEIFAQRSLKGGTNFSLKDKH